MFDFARVIKIGVEMKVITCASYYGTGSSAITDYVSEFDGVYSMTTEEFRFLQDPDGIDDLEFHLVENHNRHNAGHAIKRYKRLVDFYNGNLLGGKYAPFFHGKWKEISYRYIQDLTDFTFKGWWMYDLYDRGKIYYFRKKIINKLLHMTVWRNSPERTLNTMKSELTYCSAPTLDRFVLLTKDYIEELLLEASSGAETVLVDQIVPPTNISRYTRYFDDIKVVVVDRDPRDLYLLEKLVWKDGVIPHEDVETFVKWFKYTREHRKTEVFDPETTLFVRFEDLIYDYENETARLNNFLGLSEENHVRPQQGFNPAKSRANTRKWLECPELSKDIDYIERRLPEYIYR